MIATAEPPAWLRTEARREWFKHAPRLTREGKLTRLDASMFAVLCTSIADARRYEQMATHHKEWKRIARATRKHATNIAKQFGITPEF